MFCASGKKKDSTGWLVWASSIRGRRRAGSAGMPDLHEHLSRTQMINLVILQERRHLCSHKSVVRIVESWEIVNTSQSDEVRESVFPCGIRRSRAPTAHGADDEFHVDLNQAAQFASRTFLRFSVLN